MDYRGFDTLIETAVIFTAGIACAAVSAEKRRMIRAHDSIIVQTVSRVLIPLVQLYAVYILFFGQFSPGGGFAAGVIFGASLILAVLVFGPESFPGAMATEGSAR